MAKRKNSSSDRTEKVIILLHGFLTSSVYWKRLTPYLERAGYQVVTLDLLGFGSAANHPTSTYNYETHVAHIHRQIRSLDLTHSFTLVGHSMGALLAARYSVLYPAEIDRLFLLNPPLYKDTHQARTNLRGTSRLYRFLLDSRYRSIAWGLLRRIPKNLIENHTNASRELSLVNVIESAEFIYDLEKLHSPTTVLVGRHDRPVYLKNIPDLRVENNVKIVVEPVSHHAPILKPSLVAQIITHIT